MGLKKLSFAKGEINTSKMLRRKGLGISRNWESAAQRSLVPLASYHLNPSDPGSQELVRPSHPMSILFDQMGLGEVSLDPVPRLRIMWQGPTHSSRPQSRGAR